MAGQPGGRRRDAGQRLSRRHGDRRRADGRRGRGATVDAPVSERRPAPSCSRPSARAATWHAASTTQEFEDAGDGAELQVSRNAPNLTHLDEPRRLRRRHVRPVARPGRRRRRSRPTRSAATAAQPRRPRGVAAQPAGREADGRARRPRAGRRSGARHAQPRPDRGADRPARRLPGDARTAGVSTMAIAERPDTGPSSSTTGDGRCVGRPLGRASPGPRRRRAGGAGSPPSTTRGSASCTASRRCSSSSSAASRRCSSASSWRRPNGKLLSADLYNQVFTMHGMTMVFLVVMPHRRGVHELPDAAADRRPRRRVPAPQRASASGSSSSAASS